MARRKRREPDTTEIIVAIGAVIFVFSMIGILNFGTAFSDLEGLFVGASEEAGEPGETDSGTSGAAVASGSEASSGTQLNPSSGQSSAEVSTEVSGTSLKPSSSSFEVMPG